MSDSVRHHRRQPTRLPCPWDSPGKNTGVGCHCLLQCMKVKSESEVAQSCLTLSDPMDCSLPGSSIHGILQARVLEWGAIAFLLFKKCSYCTVLGVVVVVVVVLKTYLFQSAFVATFFLISYHLVRSLYTTSHTALPVCQCRGAPAT